MIPQEKFDELREKNVYLALGWCCKYGDGNIDKGWNIIKDKIKYSDRYYPTLAVVFDVLSNEGWE